MLNCSSVGFLRVTRSPVGETFPHHVQLFALTPLFSSIPPYPCGSAGCLLCVPLPSLPNPASQLNPALWSIQQQCVYTVVHTQHPGGFPPAGAIKGAAQEMWLRSLEEGRKWAKQERKYLSVEHVQSMVFPDGNGYVDHSEHHYRL